MELTDGLETWIYNKKEILLSKHMVYDFLFVSIEIKDETDHKFINKKTGETLDIQDGKPCSCQDQERIIKQS